MFDFLDNPWVTLVLYRGLGLMFFLGGLAGVPSKTYKKGRRNRTWSERWSKTSRDSKWSIVIGFLALIAAFASLAEIIVG